MLILGKFSLAVVTNSLNAYGTSTYIFCSVDKVCKAYCIYCTVYDNMLIGTSCNIFVGTAHFAFVVRKVIFLSHAVLVPTVNGNKLAPLKRNL
jgi:hypothetical protein